MSEKASEKRTSDRLAEEMARYGVGEEMVGKARRGWYDMFRGPREGGLGALVRELKAGGWGELVERVEGGEFDGTIEEAKEWAGTREGKTVMDAMMMGMWGEGGE